MTGSLVPACCFTSWYRHLLRNHRKKEKAPKLLRCGGTFVFIRDDGVHADGCSTCDDDGWVATDEHGQRFLSRCLD